MSNRNRKRLIVGVCLVLAVFIGIAAPRVLAHAGDDARMLYDLLNRIGQAVLLVVSLLLLFEVMRLAQVFRRSDPA